MTDIQANRFATEWVDAWNAHDLDRILSHYAADVRFTSPFVQRLAGSPDGTLHGTAALRAYFAKALEVYPELRFELSHVLAGVRSVTLVYRSVKGLLAAEVMTLDDDGRVSSVMAHYSS